MKIKPCPFCGGKANLWQWSKTTNPDINKIVYDSDTQDGFTVNIVAKFIQCQRCKAKTKDYLTEKSLIKAWNRRTKRK